MKQLYTLASATTLYVLFCFSIGSKFGDDFIEYITNY